MDTFNWCGIRISAGVAVCLWRLQGNSGYPLGTIHIDDILTHGREVLNDTLQYHFLKNFKASNIPFWIAQQEVWDFIYFLKERMIFNVLVIFKSFCLKDRM